MRSMKILAFNLFIFQVLYYYLPGIQNSILHRIRPQRCSNWAACLQKCKNQQKRKKHKITEIHVIRVEIEDITLVFNLLLTILQMIPFQKERENKQILRIWSDEKYEGSKTRMKWVCRRRHVGTYSEILGKLKRLPGGGLSKSMKTYFGKKIIRYRPRALCFNFYVLFFSFFFQYIKVERQKYHRKSILGARQGRKCSISLRVLKNCSNASRSGGSFWLSSVTYLPFDLEKN